MPKKIKRASTEPLIKKLFRKDRRTKMKEAIKRTMEENNIMTQKARQKINQSRVIAKIKREQKLKKEVKRESTRETNIQQKEQKKRNRNEYYRQWYKRNKMKKRQQSIVANASVPSIVPNASVPSIVPSASVPSNSFFFSQHLLPAVHMPQAQPCQQCVLCPSTGRPLRSYFMPPLQMNHLMNVYEYNLVKQYMNRQKVNNKDILQFVICNLAMQGQFKIKNDGQEQVKLREDSMVCGRCFQDKVVKEVWMAYVQRHRQDSRYDVELDSKRTDCWWGMNCRTQRHNYSHAKRLNHICEQTRFKQ